MGKAWAVGLLFLTAACGGAVERAAPESAVVLGSEPAKDAAAVDAGAPSVDAGRQCWAQIPNVGIVLVSCACHDGGATEILHDYCPPQQDVGTCLRADGNYVSCDKCEDAGAGYCPPVKP